MPCLVCKYFQAKEPEEHRKEREAGTCQSSCGDRWDHHTALLLYKYHPQYRQTLDGWCLFNPQPLARQAGNVCGQIEVLDYLYDDFWGLKRMDSKDHLFRWTTKQLTNLVQGSPQAREKSRLENENEELRRQLKATRKISASRWKRLQKQKQEKPDSKELEPLPENVVRLEAAE